MRREMLASNVHSLGNVKLWENTMSAKILVVDDDLDLRDSLSQYLRRHGYRVYQADSAFAARRMLQGCSPDLILLDIMMPGEDGLSFRRSLSKTRNTPTIFLSAKTSDIDRIEGLEAGADDYICKAYNPRELLARIRAVLRRGNRSHAPCQSLRFFEFDRWVLDTARRRLTRNDGLIVALSASELALIEVFVRNPNIVMSRERILDLSRKEENDVFDRSVDSQISRFRRKLERDPKAPELIKTVWGGGYQFASDVKVI